MLSICERLTSPYNVKRFRRREAWKSLWFEVILSRVIQVTPTAKKTVRAQIQQMVQPMLTFEGGSLPHAWTYPRMVDRHFTLHSKKI